MKQGWRDQTLGDVLQELRNGLNCTQARDGDGDPITRIETIATGEFNFAKVGRSPLTETQRNKFRLVDGDILFSHINSPPHIGKSALLKGNNPVYHGVNLLLFRPAKHVNSAFLQLYLTYLHSSGFWRSRCKQSVNQASVNQTDIKCVPIAVPPLEEQHQIVEILEEAFEGLARARANAEANLQNARELFDEVVNGCFQVTADRQVVRTTLGMLAEFRNGLNYTRSSTGKTVKIVGVGNFKDHLIVPVETLSEVTVDGDLADDDRLRQGDLLAVRSNGNRELIGRTMLVPNLQEDTSFSGFTIRIRLKTDDLLPEYLCEYMRTKVARRMLIDGGGGANISNLNQRLLSSLPITYPGLDDQRLVLEKLARIRGATADLVIQYQSALDDLDDLRQSILQKAFAGELT